MKIIFIKFPNYFNFSAINLFNIIFISQTYKKEYINRSDNFDNLIRHEAIHSAQGKELLWIFFYIFYCLEWIIRLVQYRNGMAAYRNISFEREAYANDTDKDYLKKRKLFASFRYITKQHR